MDMRKDQGRLWWGVVLLVLGLILLLGNFGLWGVEWGRWWPLILIAIGVIMLVSQSQPVSTAPQPGPPSATPVGTAPTEPGSGRRRYPMGAVILIGLGLAFLLSDVIGRGAFPALVLIAIGVAFLLREGWER